MKESTERKVIIENLKKAGDTQLFPKEDYLKIARVIYNMNRAAREKRQVNPEEILYSLQRDGAPEGQFFVVRNY